MEPESSSPYPQVLATRPYPESTPSSPHDPLQLPLQLPEDPSILKIQQSQQTNIHAARRAEDFLFTLKNPTASAGFEPANLGTKGQHATSRPPKSLGYQTQWESCTRPPS